MPTDNNQPNAGDSVEKPEDKVEEVSITKQELDDLKAALAERDTLKGFHDKVIAEKKESDAKAKQAQADLERAEAEKSGDIKRLLELRDQEWQSKLNEYETKFQEQASTINKYDTEKKDALIEAAASKYAAEVSTGKRHRDLTHFLKSHIKFTESGDLVVHDGKGKITSDKLESLVEFAKKEYDHLCDAPGSSGAGGMPGVEPTGKELGRNLTAVERLIDFHSK